MKKDCISALSVLHGFKFMHRDIKTENIGWSEQRKKFVLIDFGFAKFIPQKIGFVFFTKFVGTPKYACEEMKKVYLLKESGYVDEDYGKLKREEHKSRWYHRIFR